MSDVIVKQVEFSFNQLESRTMEIASKERELEATGIQFSSWGPDVITNRVEVVLRHYSIAAADRLVREFGSTMVTVSTRSEPVLPEHFGSGSKSVAPTDETRETDQPPFNSADPIYVNGKDGDPCTNGFAYTGQASDYQFGMTAGHCGSAGQPVTNGGDNEDMGSISTQYYTSNGLDFSSIKNSSFSSFIWCGSISSSDECGVLGPNPLTVTSGEVTTNDGWNGGEVRGNTVVSGKVNYCQPYSDGKTTCHVTQINWNGEEYCSEGGGSGGPVYQHQSSGSDVYAVGSMVGGAANGYQCEYQILSYALAAANGQLDYS